MSKNEGRLSIQIRKMVDKETEEFTDLAQDVKSKIENAVKLSTGLTDLDELYKSVKDIKVDTSAGYINVNMIDPKGLQHIIKAEHLKCVGTASNTNSPATIERKLGLEFSMNKNLLAALNAIDDQGANPLL